MAPIGGSIFGGGLISLIALILAILVIVNVISKGKMSTLEKVLWSIGSFVIPIIIPVVYYFFVYKK